MSAGLPAVLGLAAGAFAGTNVDNARGDRGHGGRGTSRAGPADRPRAGHRVRRPRRRRHRAWPSLLFEIPTRDHRAARPDPPRARPARPVRAPSRRGALAASAARAIGSGVLAATLITIGAGGDNLAVYIPLFRVAGSAGTVASLLVFALGEVLLTLFVLRAGRHPACAVPCHRDRRLRRPAPLLRHRDPGARRGRHALVR